MEDQFKITQMTVLRYLGISEWKGRLGSYNLITGKNGAGKSSLIKAIREAFQTSGRDPRLIHEDGDKAEILIELNDGFVTIDRKITPAGNDVKVVRDGEPLDKPVTYLKSLLGEGILNFDPTDFYLSDEKTRKRLLLSAIPFRIERAELWRMLAGRGFSECFEGVNLDDIDWDRHGLEIFESLKKLIFDKRHEANVVLTRLKKALEQDRRDIPETVDKKRFAGFDFSAAMKELERRRDLVLDNKANENKLEDLRKRNKQLTEDIEQSERDLEEYIRRQTEKIDKLKAEKAKLIEDGKAMKASVDGFTDPDVASQQKLIDEYNANQDLVYKLQEIDRREEDLAHERGVHQKLDELYQCFSGEIISEMLTQAKLPIEGITLSDDDKILLNGRDLNKLSDSEQIRFSFEVAKSTCGKLRVICVDRLEALDPESLAEFEKQAIANPDFQYVVCKVGSGPLSMNSGNGNGSKPAEVTIDSGNGNGNGNGNRFGGWKQDTLEASLYMLLTRESDAAGRWKSAVDKSLNKGVSDDDLRAMITYELNLMSTSPRGGHMHHPDLLPIAFKAGTNPRIWFNRAKTPTEKEGISPTLSGPELVTKVREVMGIEKAPSNNGGDEF